MFKQIETLYRRIKNPILYFFLFFMAIGGIFLSSTSISAASTTWTGAASSDWATAANWSSGIVPDATTDVIIPDAGTTANDPDISAGAVCLSLTIEANGVLNGNGQSITVYGSWTNSGIFNHGNGTVAFGGTVGIVTFTPGDSTYYNLAVNRSNESGDNDGVTVSGTVSVAGNLTQTDGSMVGGQIDLAGNYIIAAGADGTTYGGTATIINFNHASNDQAVVYSAGGIGACIRVDKIGGNLSVSSDLALLGWIFVQGSVSGVDTHKLSFQDIGPSFFTPGNLSYSAIEVNKLADYASYGSFIITGTATVTGDFALTDGNLSGGQIDLAGNYSIGSQANGVAPDGGASTVFNFNHASNNQSITCAAGGIGGNIRVDKAGGTLTILSNINVNGWTYVRGAVSGLSTYTLILGDDYYGVFNPGSIAYGNIEVNKTRDYINWGDLTVGAGTLTINGNLTVTDGRLGFNANNTTVNISGGVTIAAAGTLSAGTNPITLQGNWANGGTFVHGNGTVVFAGGSSMSYTFTPGASTYYNVEVNRPPVGNEYDTVHISGTATVAGNLLQTSGELADGQINLAGNYTIGATALGTNGGTATIINFNGSVNQTIACNSGGTGVHVRVDKTGGNLIVSSDIVVNSWTYVQGNVTGLDTHKLVFGDYAYGIFTPGNLIYGTVEENKSATGNAYDTVRISGTAKITGNFIQTSGQLEGGQFDLSGDYVIGTDAGGAASSNTYNATVINFNHATNNQNIVTSGGWGAHVTINKAGGNLTISDDLKLSGWTHTLGTVVGLDTRTLTLGDNFWDTFVFGNILYNNIVIQKSNHNGNWDELRVGSGTLNIQGNLTVSEGKMILNTNNPTVNVTGGVTVAAAGVLSAGSNPITVYGNWTNSGTFNHGNGTVIFVGNNSVAYTFTPGTSIYYNIIINKTNPSRDYEVLTVSGTATVSGNLTQTDGRLKDGQMNLAGNYAIGAAATGSHDSYVSTIINFNHGSNNQTVTGAVGGVGANIRIDKSGGTFSLTSNIAISGWEYVAGTVTGLDTYTLTFGGKGTGTFIPGSLVYGNIIMNNIGAGNFDALTISGIATVSGNLTHTDGRLKGGQVNLAGNYTIGASASGSLDGLVSTIINFNHGSNNKTVSCESGGICSHIRIDKSGGTLSLTNDTAVSGWTYGAGVVAGLDTYTLTFGGKGVSTFTPGSLVYGNIGINVTGASNFDEVTVSGTLNISGNLNLVDGELRLSTNNPSVNLGGNLSVASAFTFTKGTGTITFNGTTPSTFTDSSTTPQNIGKVVLDKTNTDETQNKLTLSSSLTCNTLSVDGTTGQRDILDVGNSNYILTLANAGNLADVFTLNGAFSSGNSTVKYAATNSAGIINIAPITYDSLELSGAETYALSDATTVDSNLSIGASSALNTASSDLIVNGNFTNLGSFTANTNTVTLGGTDQTLSGNTSFYNLTKQITAADTLTFTAASTTSILSGGTLMLKGQDRSNRLALRSSAAGTPWLLNVDAAAAYAFDNLDVQDSTASRALTVLNSLSGGNNINWTIINNTVAVITNTTLSQATDASGQVTVRTDISDSDQDDISLKIEYSQDNGVTWYKAYLSPDVTASVGTPTLDNSEEYQLANIETSTTNSLTFIWSTKSTQNGAGAIAYNDQTKLRITTFDNTGTSNAVSGTLIVDNASPTNVGILSLTPATDQITVTARTATDPSGLHALPYLFTETSGQDGASTSDWQAAIFTDDALLPNTQYAYQIRAWDLFRNESADSASSSVYTLSRIPTGLTFEALSSSQIKVSWESNANPAGTEYFVENLINSTDSDWITGTDFTFTGLSGGTDYSFRVKARNHDDLESDFTSAVGIATQNNGGFIAPQKPDLSYIRKVFLSNEKMDVSLIPASIVQIAVSPTAEFSNISWQDFDRDQFSRINETQKTLYLKFRTSQGGVSDVISYTPQAASQNLSDGDIVKTENGFDVYILKIKNGKLFKRLILSPSVFNSYRHLKWGNIKTVIQTEMDRYTISNLVKETMDNIIYELFPNGDTGERKALDANKPYDADSVYEINGVDRDSYRPVN